MEGNNAIWFTRLEKHEGLENPYLDPLYPGDIQISAEGMLFSANGLEAHRALLIKNELWYIPVQTYTEDPPRQAYNVCFLAKSPCPLIFSSDTTALYLTAADCGRGKVFKFPVPHACGEKAYLTAAKPTSITLWGSVSSVHAISLTLLLLTFSSHTESSVFAAVDPSTDTLQEICRHIDYISSNFAQYPSQVSSIVTFPGAGPYNFQASVVKPSSFTLGNKKRYPLLFWDHGGPMPSSLNEWSSRWNPALCAEQGYIVVLPNPKLYTLPQGQPLILSYRHQPHRRAPAPSPSAHRSCDGFDSGKRADILFLFISYLRAKEKKEVFAADHTDIYIGGSQSWNENVRLLLSKNTWWQLI
ncbi:MAG: hypothetical protein Q9161_008459 [Pseudevernia consocians]